MKPATLFWLSSLCLLSLGSHAQGLKFSLQPATTTAAGNDLFLIDSFTGEGYTTHALTASNYARSGISPVLQMSPIGGNNELLDMFSANNSFDNQIAVARSGGGNQVAAWFSHGGPGSGTNVFGYGLDLLGGVGNLGNPFWYDLPNSDANTSVTLTWFAGPSQSRLASAYLGGNTNGSTIQPVFNINADNPFSGAGGINVCASYTNSAFGSLIGTNGDGVRIYRPAFDFQFISIGDAYNAVRSAPNNQGAEAQQAPSYNIILNGHPFYISLNGSRTGDTINGQIPLLNIDCRNPNDPRFRVPYQIANVWANTNANWLDSLYVDESTGLVAVSNGTFIATNVTIIKGGWLTLANGGSSIGSTGFNVNTNVAFNNPNAGSAGMAWTTDGNGANRLGSFDQPGQFAKYGHGSGSPFTIGMLTGGSDMQANVGGSEVDELTVDANHNVIINTGQLVLNQTTNQPANTNQIKIWFIVTNNGTAFSVPGYK
jgi:hypothetical protein